jgi:flagellar basal-body rod modification protein FlgD
MASVGTSLPTNDAAQTGQSSSSNNSNGGSAPDSSSSLANQATFLQLLVAQLKNQNPTQPTDGTTFVTQLAQFSNLEQSLASRTDLDAISAKYLGTTPTTTNPASGA